MNGTMEMMVAPGCVNIPRPWTDRLGVESVNDRTCSIDGCPGKHEAKGYCTLHYQRLRKGLPLSAPPMKVPQSVVCAAEGCDDVPLAKNLCTLHYQRAKHGRDMYGFIRGVDEPHTYKLAHRRVAAARGPAKVHNCADCGCRAQEWSYDRNGGADERRGTSSKGYPAVYSVNPDHYSPRCVPCHRAYDLKKGAA